MAQCVNRLQNNIFINPLPLRLSCEISGALRLAQPGLTVGRQADEIQVNFEIFKIGCGLKYSTNAFQWVFRIKPIARLIFKVQDFQKPYDF